MKMETLATIALALWCGVCGIILTNGILDALCR